MFNNPNLGLNSNTLHFFKTHVFVSSIQILFYTLLCNIFLFSHAIPIEITYTENYLPPDDPNFTNYIVSHDDFE